MWRGRWRKRAGLRASRVRRRRRSRNGGSGVGLHRDRSPGAAREQPGSTRTSARAHIEGNSNNNNQNNNNKNNSNSNSNSNSNNNYKKITTISRPSLIVPIPAHIKNRFRRPLQPPFDEGGCLRLPRFHRARPVCIKAHINLHEWHFWCWKAELFDKSKIPRRFVLLFSFGLLCARYWSIRPQNTLTILNYIQ